MEGIEKPWVSNRAATRESVAVLNALGESIVVDMCEQCRTFRPVDGHGIEER